LSGRFVNGWQYVEGKAYSVRLEVVNEQNAKLRSAYCYDILEYSYTVHGQIGGVEWIEGVMTCVITGYSYEVYVYSTHCVGGDSGDGEYGEGSSSDDSDESSGDYGGGGDNTPQPVAPKAKQIFKNSNMTDANWEKIEKMLIKIMEDCLGAALYDGLVDELDGKALAIQFSNGSSFNYTNGTITLDVMEAESNRLYHEMWHAYQSYYETTASFGTSTLNQEMEAWYVQYLYLSKLPEYKEGSKWHQWYRATELGMAVQDLKEFVDSKGNLLQGEVPLYGYLYNTLEPTFRNNGYPLSGYSFDYNRDGGYNFRNLRRLSKDC
jgi:hypothetical protein